MNNIFDTQFISLGKIKIDKQKFNTIKNTVLNKPIGGFWASKYDNYNISEWYQYLIKEGFECGNRAVVFNLSENSNIFIIDTYEKYKEFIDFAKTVKISKPIKIIPNNDITHIIDYENISNKIDGIYFTSDIVRQLSDIYLFYIGIYERVYKGVDMTLYLYDTDTLLLFNLDCIINEKSIIINKNKRI